MIYKIGQRLKAPFCAVSEIIGIDHYTLKNFSGGTKTWASYTLISDSPKPYDRWWLVMKDNIPACWTMADSFDRDGTLLIEDSGLCKLDSDGDASLSTPYSGLLMYKIAEGHFTCAESFEGDTNLIYMRGVAITLPALVSL